jgi:hypothetical protein
MEIQRRINPKPISDPLQCFVCMEEYDHYPEDGLAWSDGERIGEVCPECLRKGADFIRGRMQEQADEADDLLAAGVVEMLYKEGDSISPVTMRSGLEDLVEKRRRFARDGVTILPARPA